MYTVERRSIPYYLIDGIIDLIDTTHTETKAILTNLRDKNPQLTGLIQLEIVQNHKTENCFYYPNKMEFVETTPLNIKEKQGLKQATENELKYANGDYLKRLYTKSNTTTTAPEKPKTPLARFIFNNTHLQPPKIKLNNITAVDGIGATAEEAAKQTVSKHKTGWYSNVLINKMIHARMVKINKQPDVTVTEFTGNNKLPAIDSAESAFSELKDPSFETPTFYEVTSSIGGTKVSYVLNCQASEHLSYDETLKQVIKNAKEKLVPDGPKEIKIQCPYNESSTHFMHHDITLTKDGNRYKADITVNDSLETSGTPSNALIKTLKKLKIADVIKAQYNPDYPQQKNNNDCGAYTANSLLHTTKEYHEYQDTAAENNRQFIDENKTVELRESQAQELFKHFTATATATDEEKKKKLLTMLMQKYLTELDRKSYSVLKTIDAIKNAKHAKHAPLIKAANKVTKKLKRDMSEEDYKKIIASASSDLTEDEDKTNYRLFIEHYCKTLRPAKTATATSTGLKDQKTESTKYLSDRNYKTTESTLSKCGYQVTLVNPESNYLELRDEISATKPSITKQGKDYNIKTDSALKNESKTDKLTRQYKALVKALISTHFARFEARDYSNDLFLDINFSIKDTHLNDVFNEREARTKLQTALEQVAKEFSKNHDCLIRFKSPLSDDMQYYNKAGYKDKNYEAAKEIITKYEKMSTEIKQKIDSLDSAVLSDLSEEQITKLNLATDSGLKTLIALITEKSDNLKNILSDQQSREALKRKVAELDKDNFNSIKDEIKKIHVSLVPSLNIEVLGENITKLTDKQIPCLIEKQIKALKNTQFTKEILQNIPNKKVKFINVKELDTNIQHLTDKQIKKLTEPQIKKLTASQIQVLADADKIKHIPNDKVKWITVAQLGLNIQHLTDKQIPRLGEDQIKALTRDQITALCTKNKFQHIETEMINKFEAGTLSQLTFQNVSDDQIRGMNTRETKDLIIQIIESGTDETFLQTHANNKLEALWTAANSITDQDAKKEVVTALLKKTLDHNGNLVTNDAALKSTVTSILDLSSIDQHSISHANFDTNISEWIKAVIEKYNKIKAAAEAVTAQATSDGNDDVDDAAQLADTSNINVQNAVRLNAVGEQVIRDTHGNENFIAIISHLIPKNRSALSRTSSVITEQVSESFIKRDSKSRLALHLNNPKILSAIKKGSLMQFMPLSCHQQGTCSL